MAVPWCWSQSLLNPHSHTYGTMENGALRSGLLCLCQLRRSLWAPSANGDYWQTNPAPLSLHHQALLLVAVLVPGGFSCYPSRMWTCVCWSERMLGYLCTMGWGVPQLLMLHFNSHTKQSWNWAAAGFGQAGVKAIRWEHGVLCGWGKMWSMLWHRAALSYLAVCVDSHHYSLTVFTIHQVEINS